MFLAMRYSAYKMPQSNGLLCSVSSLSYNLCDPYLTLSRSGLNIDLSRIAVFLRIRTSGSVPMGQQISIFIVSSLISQYISMSPYGVGTFPSAFFQSARMRFSQKSAKALPYGVNAKQVAG